MLQADEIAHAHGVHRIHINLGHESSRHARHAWLRQLCWCWFIQAARQPRKRRCELFSSQRLYGQCEYDRVWILDRVVSRCAVRATSMCVEVTFHFEIMRNKLRFFLKYATIATRSLHQPSASSDTDRKNLDFEPQCVEFIHWKRM